MNEKNTDQLSFRALFLMGRVSLELVVHSIHDTLKRQQEDARDEIHALVLRARKEDPEFFEIPCNPFANVCK